MIHFFAIISYQCFFLFVCFLVILVSLSVPGKYVYSITSLHLTACVQNYQCLIILAIFIELYALCEAATGESFGLDLTE